MKGWFPVMADNFKELEARLRQEFSVQRSWQTTILPREAVYPLSSWRGNFHLDPPRDFEARCHELIERNARRSP